MSSTIFSTYSQSENRVTSTILAVFRNLQSATFTTILQGMLDDGTLELTKFDNQIRLTDSESVPDGSIKGLFDYIIETKTERKSVRIDQIRNHLDHLDYPFSRLIVLTPDSECPLNLQEFIHENENVIWTNFDRISLGIEAILDSEGLLLLDREKFLLSELNEFLIAKGLTTEDVSDKAVIIPAGVAWNDYLNNSFYICQPDRFFQPSAYMGFYADSEIKRKLPKILGFVDRLNIVEDDLSDGRITTVNNTPKETIIERLSAFKAGLKEGERDENSKYVILTKPESPETLNLDKTIPNDKLTSSGKGTAFVQKQTYVNLDKLKKANTTTDLN